MSLVFSWGITYALLFFVVHSLNDVIPIHPTSITRNTEYYESSEAMDPNGFANGTIICNYYNQTNTSKPRNCVLLCNTILGCLYTNINCNNSPQCSLQCQHQGSCISSIINASTTQDFSLYCSSQMSNNTIKNNSNPCSFIEVTAPINVKNSSAIINCYGEQSCIGSSFDVSQTDTASIICQDTDTTAPYFGATCLGSNIMVNQNTKIICKGGRACEEARLIFKNYSYASNYSDNDWHLQCLSYDQYPDSCFGMILDAHLISNLELYCSGDNACRNGLIILSSDKESNNNIECKGHNKTCANMEIYTQSLYQLGWLNITCDIDGYNQSSVCERIEMYCYDNNIIENMDEIENGYHPLPVKCQPLDPRIIFDDWPLLNIMDTPTLINNSIAVFNGNAYQYQYLQIECPIKYDSCTLLCDDYFSCQAAYVSFNNKNKTRNNINISCTTRACIKTSFNIGHTKTLNHRCEGDLSCYKASYILTNITNDVSFNCGSSIYSPNISSYYMCGQTVLNATNLNTGLTLNCANGTKHICHNMTLYGPYYNNIRINCIGNMSCFGGIMYFNYSNDINITCAINDKTDIWACDGTQFKIHKPIGYNIDIDCIGIDDYSVTSGACILNVAIDSWGNNNYTKIHCYGSIACQFSQFNAQNEFNFNGVLDINCEVGGACNVADFYVAVSNINIDCTQSGGAGCVSSDFVFSGYNSTYPSKLNIKCSEPYSCYSAMISAISDDSYIHMDCGYNEHTRGYPYISCMNTYVAVSALSKHTNILCGDCDYMFIRVPSNYNTTDFLSMTCLTDNNCNNDHYSIVGIQINCFKDLCDNGYPFPLIRGNAKPTKIDSSGTYFIVDSNSEPYVYGFSYLECNDSNGCFVECNTNYSCTQSLFNVNYNNSLSISCNKSSSCNELNIVSTNNTNLVVNCEYGESCDALYVNGSNVNNTAISISGAATTYYSHSATILINNGNRVSLNCITIGNKKQPTDASCINMIINVTNITSLDIIGDGGIYLSKINVNSSKYFAYTANKMENIQTYLTYTNNFELIEVDNININCKDKYLCNMMNFTVYNESNVSLIFGESSSKDASNLMVVAQKLNIFAQKSHSLDITLYEQVSDCVFEGPQYASNIYCENYGCSSLDLVSINGLNDWNVTVGDTCQCNSIRECIQSYWEFECGSNLSAYSEWYGHNYCNGSTKCCSASSLNNLIKQFNNSLNKSCSNNSSDHYIIYIIIGCSSGVILLIASVIAIKFCIKYRRSKYGVTDYASIIENE